MPSAPLIGISSYAREGELPAFSLPCGYVDAVRAAGGTPVILPPGEARPEHLLEVLDGLILSGGGDLDPSCYEGAAHPSVYLVDGERDTFEMNLARAALQDRRLPLLSICRGLQVLNVVCGGTLHVHLPDHYGDRVAHRMPPRVPTHHPVRVDVDSALGRILGVETVEACSWHHQSIDALGTGLRATAWAEDGVVEAVEHTDHPWCIAVQWHPEMQLGEEPHRRLFTALVEQARRSIA